MGKIQPFTEDEILNAVVGIPAAQRDPAIIRSAQDIFDDENASIQDAARVVSLIARTAEKESDRLRAAELMLKVHEVFRPTDAPTAPIINIQINNSNGLNESIVNLVMPKVN